MMGLAGSFKSITLYWPWSKHVTFVLTLITIVIYVSYSSDAFSEVSIEKALSPVRTPPSSITPWDQEQGREEFTQSSQMKEERS